MITEAIGIGLAWFLACLFARAALYKIGAPDFYLRLMGRYLGALPTGRPAVWLLAALEGITALALLPALTRGHGLGAAAALLLAYAGLMALQLLRGRADMQCGCGGPDSQLGISWALVWRNALCAVIALSLLPGTTGSTLPATWAGLVVAALVAMLAALLYHISEQVISNAQWMDGDA